MTLYELVNNTTIQGNVDIVYYVDGEETDSRVFRHVEDLASSIADLPEGWEDCESNICGRPVTGICISRFIRRRNNYDQS